MIFQLLDRDTLKTENIYAVERVGEKTFFLTYSEYKNDFAWIDSSYFEPKSNEIVIRND